MADSMEVMILSILSPGNLSRGIDNCSGHSMAMGNLNKNKETTLTATTVLRYLAARNFMLSGTALLRGMTYSCCEELGAFKPSFHPQH